MRGEASHPDAAKAEHVEMILQELDALPTLSPIAVRLLELTASDDAETSEVIRLVSSDPALAGRVLRLCRCHPRGRANQITTIDRAVLQIGFDAVRFTVLSVQVFDILDGMSTPAGERSQTKPVFDREAFWLHALAVAVASERLATIVRMPEPIRPGEAFMAGLLHEIGQLVLHVLLPESFDRVCRVAETHSASLDHACRQVIGLDTHTAGKRLAEHWGLPQPLIDVIWLNGQPFEALPSTPNRGLIALVSLADALVCGRYVTSTAHSYRNESLAALCAPLSMQVDEIEQVAADLHPAVAERAEALGISDSWDPNTLLRSIARANASLARANAGMRQREQLARRQARVLSGITAFHETLPAAGSVLEMLGCVARSAAEVFDAQVPAAVYEAASDRGWRLVRFDSAGRPFGSRAVHPPGGDAVLKSIVDEIRTTTAAVGLLPWLEHHLDDTSMLGTLRALTLHSGVDGGSAILLLQCAVDPGEAIGDFGGLRQCWLAALAAGAQHDSAAHLTEQLAAANRELIEIHDELAQHRTLATLGEVAAGAAHEMNNPLTVISGRSQLLSLRVREPALQAMAQEISAQSHRLSDMITALRSFAEPAMPQIEPVDIADLVMRAVQRCSTNEPRQPQVNTVFAQSLPPVHVDPGMMTEALAELVRNAMEAKGARHIELRVQTDPFDDRLKIEVRDDGSGMTDHTLQHAFDPFFSAKPAGRQPGLGLARARRCVEAHGGRITLANGPGGGAVAAIWLESWRGGSSARDAEAA